MFYGEIREEIWDDFILKYYNFKRYFLCIVGELFCYMLVFSRDFGLLSWCLEMFGKV